MKSFKIQFVLAGYLILLLFCFSSCKTRGSQTKTAEWMQDNGKLKVLCTTAMVQGLVEGIGGSLIDSITLIRGESDPHSYQLVKGDDEKLAYANVIFFNGLGLEHGPSLAHYLENSQKAFSLGNYILQTSKSSIIVVGSTLDPHIWMDIDLFSKSIPHIVEVLKKHLPGKEKELDERAKALQIDLAKLHQNVLNILREVPEQKRYLVTTHDAFNYFTRAYICTKAEPKNCFEIRCQAPEGLSPDSQLSTADISRLVDHLIKYKISVVFAESNVSRDSIRKLIDSAKKKGHLVTIASKPLYADAMGQEGTAAGTYAGMILYDAETIAQCLQQ